MADGLTQEEIAKAKNRTLKSLQKGEIKQQTKEEFLRSRGNKYQAELSRRSYAGREAEARRQVRYQQIAENRRFQRSSGASAVGSAAKRINNSAQAVYRNQRAASRLVSALTSTRATGSHAGPGRPRGTYKYNIPIQQFKKIQSQKKAMAQLQAYKLTDELTKKGYTPEQIQQIIAQKQATAPQMSQQEYEQLVSQATVSPHTQAMLDEINRIHNLGKATDDNMQRIIREKRMVSNALNLMNTPNIFKSDPNRLNEWLERPETNPLRAPNIFAERPDTPHITQTHRLNVLQTSQNIDAQGRSNTLNFFGNSLSQPQQTKPIRLNFWKS